MQEEKKLYKVLGTEAIVVADLSYDAGETYELTDEQATAFAEGELELVATPGDEIPPAPEKGDEPASSTIPAGEVKKAEPWKGRPLVGRE